MGSTAVKKSAKETKKATGSSTRKRSKDSSSESDSSSSDSDTESDSTHVTSSSDSSSSSGSSSDSSSNSSSDTSSSEDSDSDSDNGESSGLPKDLQYLEKNQKQSLDNVQRLKGGLEGYVARNIDMVQAHQQKTHSETDERIKSRFKEIYMEYVTTAFGSDLDTIRKEEDIDDEGLEMLVDALESGMRSFTNSEQKMIVDGST
ncbi:hypothetical protein H4R24_000843 [Coemansia sp. RSA 988]|nr:hypothetical protein H4R24_000843 [Coemansia sp. RSA 988]